MKKKLTVRAKIPQRYKAPTVPEPHIGDKAADGWIYVGVSEDTGKPMYMSPPADNFCGWQQAQRAVEAFQKAAKKDVRLPTRNELNQIFNARSTLGIEAPRFYWTTSSYHPDGPTVIIQRLSDGVRTATYKDSGSAFALYVRH